MFDEEAHLGRHVALLRIDRHDVIGRQREFVEYGDELAARERALDLTGRAPADAQPLAGPAMQQLAVVAFEIPGNADRDRLVADPEMPSTLLATLQVECEAVVPREIVERARYPVPMEIVRCGTNNPAVAGELDRNKRRVDRAADAYRHVEALTQQVHNLIVEIERYPHVRIPGDECRGV